VKKRKPSSWVCFKNRSLAADFFIASSRQITAVDKIQGAEFANRNGGNE
jgi:hypothetical protein